MLGITTKNLKRSMRMVTREEVEKARAVYEAAREARHAEAAAAAAAAWKSRKATEAVLAKYIKLKKEFEENENGN